MSSRNHSNGAAPALDIAPDALAPALDIAPDALAPDAPDALAPDAPDAPDAPAPAGLDIAALAAAEDIERAQRVYVDVPGCPRVPTDAGSLTCVQRERRANGSLGEFMLAEIRPPKDKTSPPSVQRWPLDRIQACKSALESADVTILR